MRFGFNRDKKYVVVRDAYIGGGVILKAGDVIGPETDHVTYRRRKHLYNRRAIAEISGVEAKRSLSVRGVMLKNVANADFGKSAVDEKAEKVAPKRKYVKKDTIDEKVEKITPKRKYVKKSVD